jgi:hypothetical protein
MKEKVDAYNQVYAQLPFLSGQRLKEVQDLLKKMYLEILYTNPAGFTLTARMTTNYRCLKNIYIQRKNHRLPEWRAFCKWIESLPYFEELINTNSHTED